MTASEEIVYNSSELLNYTIPELFALNLSRVDQVVRVASLETLTC